MTAPLPLLTEEEVSAVIRDEVDERRSFGTLSCDRGQLPLKALDVNARIVGTFAHTTVTQTFKNTAGVPVEATYIFPLPDRAAATRFTMEVAGRRVEGELQERGQARRTYDAAITAGKRASIAEEERPGTFTLRVGNLMPGEDATIVLELTGPLPVVDGEVTYRFPLVVAPRYMPGTALTGEQVGDGVHVDTNAVPDASRISPPVLLKGYPNPVQLAISVSIDAAGLPLSQVRSALHAAWADENNGLLRVQVGKGDRLDRDFILRFRLGDASMRTSARGTDRRSGDDAFLLTVLPAMTSTTKRPRDLVFVVDRSGSMSGWKLVAARRAVARMIDTLRGSDRFCVMAFDDSVDYPPSLGRGLVAATDRHRFAAVEWLAGVDDRGGTEMAQPLAEAADLLAGGDLERDRVLVFVTDGQVGNEAQILKLLGQRLKKTRVFALGIDQAVNAGFMNRLAALGASGEAELVESEDRVDEVLARCHRRIDTPALSELSISVDDGDLVGDTIAPSRLPDVFDGVPAVIAGRIRRRGTQRPTIVVRARDANGQQQTLRVVVETSANPALLPGWARLHLRDLEDRFDGHQGDRGQLQQKIIATSLEAKVLCRFTAFVAVDHEVVNEGGRLHKTTQAVESPAGWA
ncbi:MAG TPA: VIT domain-containing protein, partial [Myxococcota bacterium]